MIRKDYILDRWVYYAVERAKRPHEFKPINARNAREELKEEPKICYFCPSNEHLTPPEIGRVEYKQEWKIRWFLNKFPAVENVEKKGSPKPRQRKFFSERNSYGIHEIIVETPHHKSQLADLPVKQIAELFGVFKLRIKALNSLKGIEYADVFKNHGKDAGTSLVHSHTQIMALPQVPALVREEIEAIKKYRECPYCRIIRIETGSKREIFETKNIIAIAPFASRFNYEAWIFTKRHKRAMEELEEQELQDIAAILKKILVKLKKLNASYNFFLHYSPEGEDLHFHIEITPRIATWGGFELSTNAVINSVLPEDAARFYK